MGAMALTEHGNVSSHGKLQLAAKQEGIKPIFGCEVYTGYVDEERKGQSKNHLTVLAENQEGYRNLLRLVSQSYADFHYTPTVSPESLKKHSQGLIVLSGCTGSLLATSLVGGKSISFEEASYERGKEVARRFKRTFGDSYYLEVQAFPELDNVKLINKMIARISQELKIPIVATGDVHYTRPNENEMQQILHSIGRAKSMEDLAREWGYDVPLCPPLTDGTMLRRLIGTGLTRQQAIDAIVNTEVIAQRCDVEIPTLPRLRYPIPPGYEDAKQLWDEWLKEGWRYRGVHKMPQAERERYKVQLKKEMDIIEVKDFIDYFLIVSDIVKFAKDSEIPVGPARGSAAASVACWLLRITEVDPMIFPNLVFERFIDITREDLPDIDLDFDSEQRYKIEDYAVSKYGRECVGKIGTFTYYKSKNSLDDIGKVFHVPKFKIDGVKELLLERSSGDLRASATIEDTIEQFEQAQAIVEEYPDIMKATDLEGNVKGMGVHAAGLVVSNGPITEICSIYERVIGGAQSQVISMDKHDAERHNLVKIDILGLSTMTMIAEALRMLDMPLSSLYQIDLKDPEVIDAFHRNDVTGIFQFDGRAMRSVNAELQPDSFKEVCDVNALARPGPLHNNASAEYIDIKMGRKNPQKVHPIYDAIAESTNYQLVYQEQILRIVREIGGFDWTAAAYIRKIISKKLGEQEFNRQWEKFKEGAIERGISEEQARMIWGLCITSGSYAFNAAHCVSYGMLAWWTMWLKVHHPIEFYVASLRKMPAGEDGEKHLSLLRDAYKHGVTAEPPDLRYSGRSWTAAEGRLVGGLEQVKGIGKNNSLWIEEWRDAKLAEDPDAQLDWSMLSEIKGIGKAKIQLFEDFAKTEDPYGIHWLSRHVNKVKQAIIDGELGPLPVPTHTAQEVPYSRGQDVEVVWLGILKHRNLRDLFESNFARTGEALDPETVKNPELNEWVIGIGLDDEELLSITWDRWKYRKFRKGIWSIHLNHDLVLLKGVKRGFQSRRAIYVSNMWVISPDE
jgi:DNA polymerase-3 subunit alpha